MTTKILSQDVDTAITFTYNALQLSAGSVGAPSISFTGDTNTGLFRAAPDIVNISTGSYIWTYRIS